MPVNFPEKIKMANTFEDIKYIMPPLDLSKTKKGNKNNQNKNQIQENDLVNKKRSNFECEEWLGIMKSLGITDEEMERLLKNKFTSKFVEAIGSLISIILERTNLLNLAHSHISSLNKELASLKKDNLNITKNYLELNEKFKNVKNNKYQRNESEVNTDYLNSSLVIFTH